MEPNKGAIVISDDSAWERLPGEPVHYHQWFSLYCEMGIKRTLRRTRDAIEDDELSEDRLRGLAKRWRWTERARLWDINEAKRDNDAKQRLREKRIEEVNESTVRHAESALSTVQAVFAEAERRIQCEELSEYTPNQFIALLEWATRAAATADKMRRVALGIPNETTRHERLTVNANIDLTPRQYEGLNLTAFPAMDDRPALPDPNVIEGQYNEIADKATPEAPAKPPAYWAETAQSESAS